MRRPVSRRTTITRWSLATLAFVAVGLVELRFGHGPALVSLMVLLVLIYFLGGSGSSGGYGTDGGSAEAAAQDDEHGAAP